MKRRHCHLQKNIFSIHEYQENFIGFKKKI